MRQISSAMTATPMIARFGAYEANLHTGELRKSGMRIKIQDQPFEVLVALLENPGRLVLREELQKRLWPQTPFMDFDHGLNLAVKKLRDALNDSAESPRYVETLARKGYRFISPVEFVSESDSTRRSASSSGSTPGAATAHDAGESTTGWWRSWTAGLLALVLLMASAAAYVFWQSEHSLKFARQDWVLIAAFDNRTGEPVLDGTLETVLRSYLSDSHFVNVAPEERVNDTLRLMRLPTTSRITPAIGREICLRDGGIQAMLTGSIEKFGSQYAVTVFLVNPANDITISAEATQAGSKEELLRAINRVAHSILRDLGQHDDEINKNDEKLAKVTTPSLEALSLYSRAAAAAWDDNESDLREAEQFLRRAVELDPHFASALNLLAWTIRYQGRGEPEYLPIADQALQYASSATEHEAQFIRATDYLFHHEYERAMGGFEAVAEAYPDDYRSAHNAWNIGMNRGHEQEAAYWASHVAAIRPNDPAGLLDAWISNDADPQLSREFKDRLAKLQQDGVPLQTWAQGRLDWAKRVVDFAERGDLSAAMIGAEELGPTNVRQGTWLPADFALSLGQLRKADDWTTPDMWVVRLMIAIECGDKLELKKIADASSKVELDGWAIGPALLARAGYPSEARRMQVRFAADYKRLLIGKVFTNGEIALAEGRPYEAIPQLSEAVAHFSVARQFFVFLAAEDLARALDQTGQIDGAIRVLEPLEKDHRWNFETSLAPGTDRLLLAQLYRRVGRIDDARRVESELLALWKYADPDFQPLIQLKRQSEMP